MLAAASPSSRRPWTGVRDRRAADLAFALVLLAAFVLLLVETRGLSFFADEWDFLLLRRGIAPHVFLTPHGPHLTALPIAVYKLLLAVFGSSSYLPFRVLAALNLVAIAAALGTLTRRLWGPWWGLAPVALIVCAGPGSTSTLSPFQVAYALALTGGLVTLIALTVPNRRTNIIACAALIVSLASSSQGIGFLAGAAVFLVLRGDWRRTWWVVLIPTVLYGLWYVGYGHQASETDLSLWNTALVFTVQGISSTIAGLLALTTANTGLLDPTLGQPLTFGLIALLIIALARGWRPSHLFWSALVTLLVLWFASAVSNTPGTPRFDNDPRYLLSNGTILLLCLAAAVPRPALARGAAAALLAGLLVVALTNASQYAPGRASLQSGMVYTRAETGALLLMRGTVPPAYTPSYGGNPGVVSNISAGPFFSAVDAFGSFDSDDIQTLNAAPEPVREVVDRELAAGEQLNFAVAGSAAARGTAGGSTPVLLTGRAPARGSCLNLDSPGVVVALRPGRYTFRAGKQPMTIGLARFASVNTISLGPISPGETEPLVIPNDHAGSVPWRLDLAGIGGRVCGTA